MCIISTWKSSLLLYSEAESNITAESRWRSLVHWEYLLRWRHFGKYTFFQKSRRGTRRWSLRANIKILVYEFRLCIATHTTNYKTMSFSYKCISTASTKCYHEHTQILLLFCLLAYSFILYIHAVYSCGFCSKMD